MKFVVLSSILFVALAGFTQADDKVIKTVMKEAFKGDESLFNTVAKNKGTEADAAKLAEYVKKMTEVEPPLGEAESWEKKTTALLTALEDVAKGNKQAVAAVQRAGNCKGCHGTHKPK